MATELMRAALDAASTTPLTTDALELSCLLAEEALALQGDSIELWRLTLTLATLAERDDLRAAAVERLSRLDPNDDVIRLARLNLAIERAQTVEERVDVYQRLLEPANVDRLGRPVASRLAFDYALLRQRIGDVEGFSAWLSRALELDRSNRTAAALATGFFQANVSDPLGRAELLVNLMMADPTDIPTQVSLAEHLLEHGAYAAARRIYELAQQGLRASRIKADSELMADIAIAQWATGDVNAALETIDRRQAEIDEEYRIEQARTNRTLTMVQIGELSGPVNPTLAAVTAVMHAGRNDPRAAEARDRALTAYARQIEQDAARPDAVPAAMAARHLEAAWLALWLGDDQNRAAQHLAAAEAIEPLSDDARKRFDGWAAVNAGEFDHAVELLTPLAQGGDVAARVGLAVALERTGDTRTAATHLLELNRAQPGTMIGIWASEQLVRLLGQRVALSSKAVELDRLIASIPRTFDRYPREPSMAVSLRVSYPNANPGAYEPLLATVELTNVSALPLAIDRDGPLRPQVLIVPTVNTAVPFDFTPKVIVIDLGSRLRLMPRESVRTTVDLRWHSLGEAFSRLASVGGIVRMTVTSNFIATNDGGVVSAAFGTEIEAPLLRIDGARSGWQEPALATLNNADADQESLMMAVALMANAIHLADSNPGAARSTVLDQARAALPAAFSRLDGLRQAWALSVMHSPPTALLDVARRSESRHTRLAYLLYHLTGTTDPMLDAARRSEDAALRNVADAMASGLTLRSGLNANQRRR